MRFDSHFSRRFTKHEIGNLYFETDGRTGDLMLKNLTKDLENVAYSERFAGIGSKRPGGFANLVSNDAKYRGFKRDANELKANAVDVVGRRCNT